MHIDDFASLLLDGVAGNTSRTFVIGDDGSGRLWVTEVNECGTDSGGFAGAEEEYAELGFTSGCHYIFQYGTDYVDGSVRWWERSAKR